MCPHLEREKYFRGKSGERFELNAILPDTRRIEYIERKLEENGVRGKVIPPNDRLGELSGDLYREMQEAWIDERVKGMFLEKVKEELVEEFKERFELEASSVRESIEEKFGEDRALSWRTAVKKRVAELQEEHDTDLRDALREKVAEALKESE
jgi:hypothetical protein